jgi:DNA-binding Lrp family transcriptional regulator
MRLQNRDIELMKMICDFGLISTKQVGDLFFKDVAITTVLKRLRILEEEKYIKRVTGLESHELLWSIDNKGARLIEKEYFKTIWNKQMIDHDHKISSLRQILLRFKMYESWIPEHEIRSLVYKKNSFKGSLNKLIPDGLMTYKKNGVLETVAIEMELNLKNKERYERVFREYGKKENLSGIWYLVKGESIFKSLKENYKRCSHLLNEKGFMISLIDEVLINPLEAKIFQPNRIELLPNFFGVRDLQLAQVPAQGMSNLNLKNNVLQKSLSHDYHTAMLGFKN